MVYALVHYPDIDTGRIHQFRRKYDPQAELIAPHITLMFPVPDSIRTDKLVCHLERVLGSQQSFPIHLHGLQVSPDDHLFLLLQEGSGGVIRLHEAIYTDWLAAYWRKEIPFVPHLTLGVAEKDPANRERALEEAQQLRIDHRGMLDRLDLVKVNDDRSRIVWSKEFRLEK